jgi:hypothetical protein
LAVGDLGVMPRCVTLSGDGKKGLEFMVKMVDGVSRVRHRQGLGHYDGGIHLTATLGIVET